MVETLKVMNVKHRALQLTLKEQPVAFDYHGWYDSLLVATPGAISFHRISDNGTPNQLFYYDESRKLKGIRVQQHDKALIAAVHEKEVTIWDPKNHVAPMSHALVASSGVTDCQWSRDDPNLFSMTLSSGVISIWDTRALVRPSQQLLLGKKSQKMEWCPVDPYLVAVSTESKYVLLWDTRKLPGTLSSPACTNPDQCYMLLEPEAGLVDFTWAGDVGQKSLNDTCSPYVWTMSDRTNMLELHRISRSDQVFHSNVEIAHPSKACNVKSKVVAQPNGQGLMLYYEDRDESQAAINNICTKFNFVDVHHHQNIDSDTTIAKSTGKILGGHWREAQHGSYNSTESFQKSFLAFTKTGQLHIFDWIKRKHSNSCDEKSFIKSKSSQSEGAAVSGSSSLAKHKGKFLPKKIKSTIGMSAIKDNEIDLDSPNIVPNRNVVGPKTFLLLVKDDISALEVAIRHGNIEGIRVGAIDHFTRQIVLEILIPSADQFTINNFNASFNNHFRKEELSEFYSKGAPGRIFELSMIFPIKTSQFWVTPRIALENKSSLQVKYISLIF